METAGPGLFWTMIVGWSAGTIAMRLLGRRYSAFASLALGFAGALLGAVAARAVGAPAGLTGLIVAATLGALAILSLWTLLVRR